MSPRKPPISIPSSRPPSAKSWPWPSRSARGVPRRRRGGRPSDAALVVGMDEHRRPHHRPAFRRPAAAGLHRPGHRRTSPGSSSWTSRRPGSTPGRRSISTICWGPLNTREGITIVLVTHDIGIVDRHITKVACLNQRLIYHGTHAEFCRSRRGRGDAGRRPPPRLPPPLGPGPMSASCTTPSCSGPWPPGSSSPWPAPSWASSCFSARTP